MQKKFKLQLCSSSSSEIIQKTIRNAHFGNYMDFDVKICKVCSLIQLNNFMSEGKTRNYYKFKYLEDTYKYQVRPDYFVQDQKLRGKNVFNFLIKNKNIFNKEFKDLDVIDVGCDTGGTLDYFIGKTKKYYGCGSDSKISETSKKTWV